MTNVTTATSTISNGSRTYFQAAESVFDVFGDLVTYATNTLATAVQITPPTSTT